jgi:hypothetical protein
VIVIGQVVRIQGGLHCALKLLNTHGPGCWAKSVVVPVLFGTDHFRGIGNWSTIEEIIKGGFDVKWKEDAACSACTGSKGVCGYDPSKNQPTCYCPNQSYGLICATAYQSSPSAFDYIRYVSNFIVLG